MSIKNKLFIRLGLSVLIVFLLFSVFINWRITEIIDNEDKMYNELLSNAINSSMEQQLAGAEVAVLDIANNSEVQKAFAERDRERLIKMLLPSYNTIKDRVSQVQFHLPDSTAFLRLHAPEKFGDSLKEFRFTVNECNKSKRIIAGLEEGKGGYGFRVVVPMFYEGQHTGSVEFGMDFGRSYLEGLKKSFAGEYFIYTFPDENSIAWEELQKSNGLLASTLDKDDWPVDESDISRLKAGEALSRWSQDNKSYILLMPFKDYAGNVKGYFKVVQNESQEIAERNALKISMYVFSAIVAVITALLLLLMLVKEFKPLDKLQKEIQIIASGDLSHNIEIKSKDEIGKIGLSFKNMQNSYIEILKKLQSISANLVDSSEELSAAVEHSKISSKEIVSSVQEISAGLQESSASIEETNASLEELSASAESISKSCQEAVGESLEIDRAAAGGGKNVEELIRSVSRMAESADKVGSIIAGLSQTSQEIGKIVDLISNITGQTNLLALNAAIEAARAGEAGRGFAVVAEEVRKLAEESSRAADDIRKLISEVQLKIENSVAAIDGTRSVVAEGVNNANIVEESIKTIISSIDKISGKIKDIASAAEEQAAMSEQMNSAIEEISKASTNSAERSQEINEAVEEQVKVVEKIDELSKNMDNITVEMQEMIYNFKLDEINKECWNVMNCPEDRQQKCPAYCNEEKRCWLIEGTWCGGVQQGDVNSKRQRCMRCEFFKDVNKIG